MCFGNNESNFNGFSEFNNFNAGGFNNPGFSGNNFSGRYSSNACPLTFNIGNSFYGTDGSFSGFGRPLRGIQCRCRCRRF